MKNSMERETFCAWAKINISLDVISRMENGYHSLRMVMQSVSLCDDVDITVKKGCGRITVSTDRGYLPSGERNIAGKAARAFCDARACRDADIEIRIKKRIPVCAGLGGGSSDAAAVLRGLNSLLSAGASMEELERIGALVGSDVPYCVRGGTVLAEGRGEILTDLPRMPECFAVICKPEFSISTPELFGRIDCKKIKCRPDTDGIIAALRRGDAANVARRMFNVFEDVLPDEYGEVAAVRQKLVEFGAMGAVMSGTGSAVFGLFSGREAAENARTALSERYRRCFTAEMRGKNL